jgi:hypothetical protein
VKYGAVTLICVLSLCGLLSCGLESDAYFEDYIPRSDYNGIRSFIDLPSDNAENTVFSNFMIFYRIYISGGTQVQTGEYLRDDSAARSAINPSLNTDYNTLYRLTDITITTVNTSNLENTFSNQGYYVLNLENADINRVLGSDALRKRLEIAFPPNPGEEPTLTINGVSHILQRARGAPAGQSVIFNPRPDRNLLNSPALYNNDNITNFNTDTVAYNADTSRYTYVSMYIIAKGMSTSDMPPRSVYIQPTFIGIFRLADSG